MSGIVPEKGSSTNPISSKVLGLLDNGQQKQFVSTAEGHLEIAIHGPRLPFGSVHTENLTPIFQSDAVYGLNSTEVTATTGLAVGSGANSGGTTGTNNVFKCSTGTTQYSFGAIQSRKRLRYRAGQGIVGRFAGFFSTPAVNSILVAGFGSAESGFYFGYNGTSFGILHSTGGVREIQTLTLSAGAGGSENVTVKLNNIDTVVAVTAGSTTFNAYQLSQATYPGWKAQQRGATVIFVADSVGVKASTFSVTSTGTLAGSFAETLAGVASTDTWIPKTSWNGDKLDGSGASGYNLDPSKGNVYQIGIQYLGFGTISFQVEVTSDDNNADFVTVHTIKYPNTATTTSISNPSFPFTMSAYSAGSTTDVSVSVGSFAGFIEGQKKLTGPRMTYDDVSTAVTTGGYYCLLTVRNDYLYNGRANQAVVNLLSFGAAHDDATPVTFYLLKNAALVGTPNFTQWSTNSCTYVDTAATTATISSNEQILFSLPIGQSGSGLFAFEDEVTLQPGETVTIAAKAVVGTATYSIATLNTREDQ